MCDSREKSNTWHILVIGDHISFAPLPLMPDIEIPCGGDRGGESDGGMTSSIEGGDGDSESYGESGGGGPEGAAGCSTCNNSVSQSHLLHKLLCHTVRVIGVRGLNRSEPV